MFPQSSCRGLIVESMKRSFGQLWPLFLFACCLFLWFSLIRTLLYGMYFTRVWPIEDSLWCFLVGIRMDSIITSYLLILPTLVQLLRPQPFKRFTDPLLSFYFAAWGALVVHLGVASFPFMAQYDSRPNRLFFEYLVHPKEVLGLLLAEYKFALFLAGVLTAGAFVAILRGSREKLAEAEDFGWGRRLLVLPIAVVLLFLGARSSLRHRGANLSTAAFSEDHLTNQLALNSTYSLAYAIYSLRHEMDPGRLYGRMPRDEVFQRVHKYYDAPSKVDPQFPLTRTQRVAPKSNPPKNLVVFMQESLGAEYVPCLGGKPLTPELCELASEGTLFTQMYSTGTRTVRGLEAIASGFLPTPGRSVVKLGKSQRNFFTLGELLKQRGSRTGFFYGGESHFDNMRSFLLGNGFQEVWDELRFENPSFHGTWGVSDEDLVRETNLALRQFGSQPFFALMLSTSNHSPFEFPDGKIELYEEPKATVHNAIKYADFSIGEFFRQAKQEDYYKDTLFLVVADHDTRVYGSDLIPVPKFRIPALLIGPGIPKGERVDRLASQIDLIPTLLAAMGLETSHPVPGKDLLAKAPGVPDRTVMQFGTTHGFRVGDHVVVHQPKKAAQHFRYENQRLVPAERDPELEKDALAHALAPGILYREGSYTLPKK